MKIIHRVQYVSQGKDAATHLANIAVAVKAGIPWAQLRLKGGDADSLLAAALSARAICKEHGAVFIMNDHVQIALESDADGVHLGKDDMPPDEARRLLGSDKIIGGTANDFEDIKRLQGMGVDYVGLGPFRFTTTKKKLSPVLGLEGYARILAEMREKGIEVPIFAIGGIATTDLTPLSETGIYGIAVSGWLTPPPPLVVEILRDAAFL